jgi:hypothetical protein
MRAAGLTLAELADLLDPPVTVEQVKNLIHAVQLQPVSYRRTGRQGRPAPEYDARLVMQAHGALSQFWGDDSADHQAAEQVELADVELADSGTVTPRRVIHGW